MFFSYLLTLYISWRLLICSPLSGLVSLSIFAVAYFQFFLHFQHKLTVPQWPPTPESPSSIFTSFSLSRSFCFCPEIDIALAKKSKIPGVRKERGQQALVNQTATATTTTARNEKKWSVNKTAQKEQPTTRMGRESAENVTKVPGSNTIMILMRW